ncbi:hypothetical protein M427DRAFT_155021 [Gonapodya prolifera JEL478]|uniref:Uncharacterized protein n=1 Tax=Gonapodya prolifera (strain JEL478) TaxID=1344416 RepID=A0A139AGT9_GONPJ|nr:hypothetical protein M427DRAFT_155021 [Gonapodya prolifera JEL478]|eukprot:KXS15970.1 hypothetical protein M427DRAFT_155021 [Gonapodya prolifera JEL478]
MWSMLDRRTTRGLFCTLLELRECASGWQYCLRGPLYSRSWSLEDAINQKRNIAALRQRGECGFEFASIRPPRRVSFCFPPLKEPWKQPEVSVDCLPRLRPRGKGVYGKLGSRFRSLDRLARMRSNLSLFMNPDVKEGCGLV